MTNLNEISWNIPIFGISLDLLGITMFVPTYTILIPRVQIPLDESVPVGQVSISRVKSGLLEISQNELISAGISRR